MRSQHMLISLATLGLATSVTLAQQPQQDRQQQQDRWQQDRQQQQDRQHQRMQQDELQQMMMLHHADDEIVNASVTNLQQENLGNIDSLVVEAGSGKVVYALVSFGGFLGIGDTLHAVPWSAFAYRPLYDGLVLDVSRSQLEQQEGFTRDRMPNFADERWGRTVHQHYGAQPYWERQDRRWRDEDMPRRDRRQPMQDDAQGEQIYPGMEQQQFITTNRLIGMEIENMQGEQVGTIRDFAMNLKTGEIDHVVVGYGGWLGIGETNTAMPWHVFQMRDLATDAPRAVLDITQEQLRGAPEYSLDRWPRIGAGQWADGFGARAAQ